MNLDPEDVRARVTDKTKAIMPVHLFGRPAPLGELAELGVPLVEDAAQAFGAQGVGTSGDRLDLQLLPDEEPVRARRRWSRHDARRRARRAHPAPALPRLEGEEGLQAHRLQLAPRRDAGRGARVFLPHLEEWNRSRREAAARYAELGLGEVCELPTDEPGHVYHVFVVRTRPSATGSASTCQAAGIASAAYYETPLHLQPRSRCLGHSEGDFPETERASRENLALPMWAGIGADVQEQVVSAVKEAVSLEAVR